VADFEALGLHRLCDGPQRLSLSPQGRYVTDSRLLGFVRPELAVLAAAIGTPPALESGGPTRRKGTSRRGWLKSRRTYQANARDRLSLCRQAPRRERRKCTQQSRNHFESRCPNIAAEIEQVLPFDDGSIVERAPAFQSRFRCGYASRIHIFHGRSCCLSTSERGVSLKRINTRMNL
jgi:hypothetical protein